MKLINASKADTGLYTATAKNVHGVDISSELNVKVLGVPGTPKTVEANNVTAKSALISWQAPSENGGSDVVSYKVELCESNKTTWTVVASDVSFLCTALKQLNFLLIFIILCSFRFEIQNLR